MTDPATPVSDSALHVHVVGIVRGKEIDSQAEMALDQQAVVIVWTRAAPWRLSLAGVDGISVSESQLTMYLASSDVLDISGDERLRTFGQQLIDRACTMPELTRGLRTLGSRRGALGASHDAWFAPLLNALRAVHGVSDPLRQVTLVDARHLAEVYASVITELAAIQAPTDKAAQRAIEAILEEEAEPVFRALDRMALAGDALQGSALDTRLLDWRRWIDELQAVFVAGDEAWGKISRYVGRVE